MKKNGQFAVGRRATGIPTVPYRPTPGRPPGLEVLDLPRLAARADASERPLTVPVRPAFHLLVALRSGRLACSVDFTSYALEAGDWLWVWPGQVLRFPGDADATVLVFPSGFPSAATDTLIRGGEHTPYRLVTPEADITELVGAGEEFRVTVGVNNELTNLTIPPGTIKVAQDGRRTQKYLHDFYNYAGIARSVRLHSVPAVHIDDITIATGIEGAVGIVDYSVETTASARVRVRVLDAGGTQVAAVEGATIEDVTPWRPGAAHLYELVAEIIDGDEVTDSYTLPFGVRTVEIRGRDFLINGEPFYFTGFGKHEDSPVRGKGHDDAYLVHDFQLMEWIGASSFRTSHYPYAEEVLEFADRHGIVVIDETAAVGLNLAVEGGLAGRPHKPTFSPDTFNDDTRAAHAQAVRELVARDKNRPSVVMWCIANEPSSHEDVAREYFEPLVELTRKLDPTRPVSYAAVMFATYKNDRIADLFDIVCLNRYYGWYVATGDLATAETYMDMELRGWAEKSDMPILMSEYGADALPGLHSVWDMPWTEEYQLAYLEANHRAFDRSEAVVGEHVWNFADFQTSNGIHRVDGNRKGIFTRDRRPKAAAHALRTRWKSLGGRKPSHD